MKNCKHIRVIELSNDQENHLRAGDSIELPYNEGKWVDYAWSTDALGFEIVHLHQI